MREQIFNFQCYRGRTLLVDDNVWIGSKSEGEVVEMIGVLEYPNCWHE